MIGEAVALLCTHDISNTLLLFLFIPSDFAAIFFSLSRFMRTKRLTRDSGSQEEGLKIYFTIKECKFIFLRAEFIAKM